jgi:hypothetical protein
MASGMSLRKSQRTNGENMTIFDNVFTGRKKEERETGFIATPGANPRLRELLERVEAIEERLDAIERMLQTESVRREAPTYQPKYPAPKKRRLVKVV